MASWIKFGAVLVALALGVSVLVAWRDARQQQEALQTELKNTQQALADATARQASRDQALNSLLTQLKKNKAAVQTPEQAIAALPKVLPLPQPITLGPSGANTTEAGADASQAKPNAKATPSQADASHATKAPASEGGRYKGAPVTADFPAADLKPLYDFAVDCKSCQAQLAAAQADLKDEQTKEQALGRERDAALRAAKGGSALRRMARAAKWFAIGAAAGAIAAKAAH